MINQTLTTFLKIVVTTLTIGILLFGVGYAMIEKEVKEYKSKIESVRDNLPDSTSINP